MSGKALPQLCYINKTHAPQNVNYCAPALPDGPCSAAKLGLIWGGWGGVGGTAGVTPSRSREGSCGMAERSGGLVFAALMKTSGSFRSEIRHRAREFSSQPSAGLHNSEEPSRGNAIMRRCRSERRDRMLQRLPGRGPRRALVSLTL